MLPESAGLLGSEGYEIIIRSKRKLDIEISAILSEVASREKLSVRQRPTTTMIYNPAHYTLTE